MIGSRIKERRLQLGLTQEELAHRMGYKSKSTITKIEKEIHDVNQETLLKFAEVLNVEPNYFIEGMSHAYYGHDAAWEYARRLMKLPPDVLDNAIQYIEFLERKLEEEKQ